MFGIHKYFKVDDSAIISAVVKFSSSKLYLQLYLKITPDLNHFSLGLSLGTTKKGIGPAYSSKMNRSGLRVADLVYGDFGLRFEERFRRLVADYTDAFDKLTVDVESEVKRYREIADIIRPFVTETVSYLHNKVWQFKEIYFFKIGNFCVALKD